MEKECKRIETEIEVKSYLANLKYALNNGATINFQIERRIDNERDMRNTNSYTVATLFPEENPADALKRELLTLTSEEYICTVKDLRFPKRSDMRVFGKVYNAVDDVYIKIRVELVDPNNCNNHTTFVMSFHFAEEPFEKRRFSLSEELVQIGGAVMKVLRKENKLCLSCMETHEVLIVEVDEKNIFKGKEVTYTAVYEYCDKADEYYASERQLSDNDVMMKNAYRIQNGLLTSQQIAEIRCMYGITQSDLATLLGWGEKTITRYEGHHVQDFAHDTILRKIEVDPEWYIELLKMAKEKFSSSSYQKYYETALCVLENQQNQYLRKVIQTLYLKYEGLEECTGGKKLDLDKVIDVIRYFSNSSKVKFLYKVKLMKLLWYSDALMYKKNAVSMTGLVYEALPMGAVPIGYQHIIDLNGVCYEEKFFDDGTGYQFVGDDNESYPYLSDEDKKVLDYVIECFADITGRNIADKMHKELAYIETAPKDIIQYKYAKELSI